MRFVWRLTVGLFAWLGFLVLVLVVGAVALGSWALREWRAASPLPEHMVLTADLREAIAETAGGGGLAEFSLRSKPTLSEMVLALDRAATDSRVAGLVAILGESEHGLAVTQELRDAVKRLQASGKFTIAWADSFGELSPGNEAYYLATAFDEIYLQPAGLVGLTGIAAEQPFAASLLYRFGIDFQVIRRSEYKTAFESLTNPDITAPNREMLQTVIDDLNVQLGEGIAEGRKLPPERVSQLLTAGPFTAEQAREAGLIDQISYRDELPERVRSRAPDAREVSLDHYLGEADGPAEPAGHVALVQADGLITRGSGSGFGLAIAADPLSELLIRAGEDPKIDAIVLRLSSRGGSPAASETIARAIRRTVQAGKPVIVSMGNVAASGGYWVASPATKIVAQPATLTGSIGVIAGKPVLDTLWSQLDVNWATISPGGNAGMWSINRPFTPEQNRQLDQLVGNVYDQFKERVMDGRKLPADRVEWLARGRVWTGAAAQPLQLVDRLGGLHEALAEARGALGLPDNAPLAVELTPERGWPLEELLSALSDEFSITALVQQALASLVGGQAAEAPALRLR